MGINPGSRWRSRCCIALGPELELLILDDWGLAAITPDQARYLLEIVDYRHDRGSTIVTLIRVPSLLAAAA